MVGILRQFLCALIVFAVIGGTTNQLARSAGYQATTMNSKVPCDMAMPMVDAGPGNPMAPCKGLTPDCIKQMGCVADVALAARFAVGETTVRLGTVAYWDVRPLIVGVVNPPEPLPPRAG